MNHADKYYHALDCNLKHHIETAVHPASKKLRSDLNAPIRRWYEEVPQQSASEGLVSDISDRCDISEVFNDKLPLPGETDMDDAEINEQRGLRREAWEDQYMDVQRNESDHANDLGGGGFEESGSSAKGKRDGSELAQFTTYDIEDAPIAPESHDLLFTRGARDQSFIHQVWLHQCSGILLRTVVLYISWLQPACND